MKGTVAAATLTDSPASGVADNETTNLAVVVDVDDWVTDASRTYTAKRPNWSRMRPTPWVSPITALTEPDNVSLIVSTRSWKASPYTVTFTSFWVSFGRNVSTVGGMGT